jgi:type IV pilus assembly protein PilC
MTIFKETGLPAVPEFHRIRFILNVLPVFIGLLVILIFGFSFLRFVTRRIKNARLLVDWMSLRLPVIGGITKKVAIVRFSRTLAALFQSGVPVLMALNIVRNQETNTAIQGLYEQMNHGIKEGEGLAAQLERTKFFPHTFVWMASVGEHSGKLEQALNDAADFYTLEADTHLGNIVSITLPVCVIFAGVFVGTIIISMFSLLVKVQTFLLLGGI